MGAPGPASGLELRELRSIRAEPLEALLAEEAALWREHLFWDFRANADLITRYVGMQSLSGWALVDGPRVAGYSYYVADEHKGLIGDLYLAAGSRTLENETRLLAATVRSLIEKPGVRRIEAQLLMLLPGPRSDVPYAAFHRAHPRNYMLLDLAAAPLPPGRAAGRFWFENWKERHQADAARLIAAAYQGHIDGEVNDQYRTSAGARRFLLNIVQYPGCGNFFQAGSFLAFDRSGGALSGMSLASLLADDSGHITQVCVAPRVQRCGLGYELLRRSLQALAEYGCRKASLTVTAANQNAVHLYLRMGFTIHHQFDALVWEGF